MTVALSGRITTQTVISGEPSAARTTAGPNGGRRRPKARPEPTGAEPTMKERRLIFGLVIMVAPSGLGCSSVDRVADFLERAATADVGHRRVDVRVGGLGLGFQQRSGSHDHAGLAVAALRHLMLDPGLLHLRQLAARRETLDGGDLASLHGPGRHRT